MAVRPSIMDLSKILSPNSREVAQMEGYVYVLTTPATNLLKIGKTARDPDLRARELSSGTGVPFPFTVAYSVYVSDCSTLEFLVHARLASRRASTKREFFDVSLEEAISCIEYFLLEPTSVSGTVKDDSFATSGATILKTQTTLRLNPDLALGPDLQEDSNEPRFDPLSYARERMIESAKVRIDLFKAIFLRSVDVYRIIQPLEGQPMRSGKQYPPFTISISTDTMTVYFSFLNLGPAQEVGYDLGFLRSTTINKDTQEEARDIAKSIIDNAAPVFLERELAKYLQYDPEIDYSALDYRASLLRSSDSTLLDVKPDIINYLEGYADLNYLAAKYLDLPYPFPQFASGDTRIIQNDIPGDKVTSSPKPTSIKGFLSKLLLPPK